MEDMSKKNIGMEKLIETYTKKFETQENLNYYSYKDFLRAKRKYLKYVLGGSFDESASLIN